MLAAAWTLAVGGHVRVDIFYADASPRRKALVDLLGALLVAAAVHGGAARLLSLPYVARSWAIFERSRETSGLPLVFLLKTLIPVFALLMRCRAHRSAIRAGAVSLAVATTDAGKLMTGASGTPRHRSWWSRVCARC